MPITTSGQLSVAPQVTASYQLTARARRHSRVLGTATVEVDLGSCKIHSDDSFIFAITQTIKHQIETDTTGLYSRAAFPPPPPLVAISGDRIVIALRLSKRVDNFPIRRSTSMRVSASKWTRYPELGVNQSRQSGNVLDAGRHRAGSMGIGNNGREAIMAVQTQERAEMVNALLERIGETVGQRAHVSTIFGEPVEREGVTVIPVGKARFGFGGGGGSGARQGDEGAGGGGGGGVAVGPIGYIELHEGGARFKRILTPTDLLALVVAASFAVSTVKRLFD
jgi:uncharacterized spore protein YtfJ